MTPSATILLAPGAAALSPTCRPAIPGAGAPAAGSRRQRARAAGHAGLLQPHEITLQLQDKPTPAKDEPAQTVRLAVQPGPRTQVERGHCHRHADTPDLKRRQAQLQRNWGLPRASPSPSRPGTRPKAQGLRSLQARRYPRRALPSRADIAADSAQARLSVQYDSGPAYRFGPLQIRGGERYDSVGLARIAPAAHGPGLPRKPAARRPAAPGRQWLLRRRVPDAGHRRRRPAGRARHRPGARCAATKTGVRRRHLHRQRPAPVHGP